MHSRDSTVRTSSLIGTSRGRRCVLVCIPTTTLRLKSQYCGCSRNCSLRRSPLPRATMTASRSRLRAPRVTFTVAFRSFPLASTTGFSRTAISAVSSSQCRYLYCWLSNRNSFTFRHGLLAACSSSTARVKIRERTANRKLTDAGLRVVPRLLLDCASWRLVLSIARGEISRKVWPSNVSHQNFAMYSSLRQVRLFVLAQGIYVSLTNSANNCIPSCRMPYMPSNTSDRAFLSACSACHLVVAADTASRYRFPLI